MRDIDEAQHFWRLQDIALTAAQAASDQPERLRQIELAEQYGAQAARLEARLPRPHGPVVTG